MSVHQLTCRRTADFAHWIHPDGSRLGLAITSTQIAIADRRDAWVAHVNDPRAVKSMIDVLRGSGRRVWARRASSIATQLARRHAIAITELDWLRDASTAHASLHPGNSDHWLVDDSAPQLATSAANLAANIAREITSIETAAGPEVPRLLRDTALDLHWRPRSLQGYRVDAQQLHELDSSARRAISAYALDLGIDLSRVTDAKDRDRAHRWLGEVGIVIRDAAGAPSLSRDDYTRAIVPTTAAARARWNAFSSVHRLASNARKRRELDRATDGDRLRPEHIVRHTKTGRATVRRPALQNLTHSQRALLLADPGRQLVGADFSQIEVRIAAALSGDPTLHADLARGDVYLALAEGVFGAARANDQRGAAKKTLLGLLYGQGANGLANTLAISTADARGMIERTRQRYGTLRGWTADRAADFERGTPAFTYTGRPIVPPEPGKRYQTLNRHAQSTAADVFADAVHRVVDALGADVLYIGVHDEIVVEVPDNEVLRAERVLATVVSTVLDGADLPATPHRYGHSLSK